MNKKNYKIYLIVIGLLLAGFVAIQLIYDKPGWIWVFLASGAAYLFIKIKINAPIQSFANKFNMLVDYDLKISEAIDMAKEHAEEAPTKNLEALYQVYLGMGQYYKGNYTEAIKTFNLIDLNRLNVVYHILIFAHICYASFELGDWDTLDSTIERMHNLEPRVSKRYKGILFGYLEVLESTRDMEEDPETYKEIIEKHFQNNDGYIATKLNYHYRMALYYKVKNFTQEMDEHLAFVIANGGEHHSKKQALKLFQDSVDPDDYIYDPESDENDDGLLPGEKEDEEPLTLEADVTSEEIIEEEPDEDEEKE